MDELKKLKQKLKRRMDALEDARLILDTDIIPWLKDEIQDLQEQIEAIEKGRRLDNEI